MATSYPNRTSPVIRGKWILENVFGAPPPPPPPNVPELKDDRDPRKVLPMREQLAAHRANPACAGCHAQMDQLGFALENFDGIGEWRDLYASGARVDASAQLPDGTKFNGPAELRKVLLRAFRRVPDDDHREAVDVCPWRGLEASDAPAVRKIKRDAARAEQPLCFDYSGDCDEYTVYNEDGGRGRELTAEAVPAQPDDRVSGSAGRSGGCRMVITKLALPRRTFIRGMGATVALPFLDAMVPALRAQAKGAPRFTAIYCGNGANMVDWTPATDGVGFEMSPSLKPIEAFRDRLLVVTGLDNFQATDQGDVGGQHPRAAPAFMSCAHPKQTEGADVQAGTTIDQIDRREDLPRHEAAVARSLGRPQRRRRRVRPRLRLRLHELDVVEDARRSRCRSETNPRFVFERMFGVGATAEERLARVQEDRSILDGLTQEISHLRSRLGASDRTKLGQYFDAVRDVEQRIVEGRIDQQRLRGARSAGRRARNVQGIHRADVRPAGAGVPGRHHARQLADDGARKRQSRVSRDWPARGASLDLAPREQSGEDEELHEAEHLSHRNARIFPQEAAGDQADSDGSLLDHTVVLWGSGMSDGNVHNNYNVPVVVVGGRNRCRSRANRHVKSPKGTPLANLMLGVMDRFGVERDKFGDSTSEIDLLTV